jgi:uncharacterized protein involved in exopolysaccharide biosynthesis
MSQQAASKATDQVVTPEAEPYEPLLPVEKKLIVTSLVLGVVILLILVVVSYTLFPGAF